MKPKVEDHSVENGQNNPVETKVKRGRPKRNNIEPAHNSSDEEESSSENLPYVNDAEDDEMTGHSSSGKKKSAATLRLKKRKNAVDDEVECKNSSRMQRPYQPQQHQQKEPSRALKTSEQFYAHEQISDHYMVEERFLRRPHPPQLHAAPPLISSRSLPPLHYDNFYDNSSNTAYVEDTRGSGSINQIQYRNANNHLQQQQQQPLPQQAPIPRRRQIYDDNNQDYGVVANDYYYKPAEGRDVRAVVAPPLYDHPSSNIHQQHLIVPSQHRQYYGTTDIDYLEPISHRSYLQHQHPPLHRSYLNEHQGGNNHDRDNTTPSVPPKLPRRENYYG